MKYFVGIQCNLHAKPFCFFSNSLASKFISIDRDREQKFAIHERKKIFFIFNFRQRIERRKKIKNVRASIFELIIHEFDIWIKA